jgi:RNA polymerase sigma factor, sigma-70 family
MEEKLTPREQEMIEEALWAVNTALKLQGLSHDEDLRQDTILLLCKYVKRFDESFNTKWTTYAFKTAYLYAKRASAKNFQKQSRLVYGVSETIEDGYQLQQLNFIEDDIRADLNDLQKNIFDMLMDGYTKNEIAKKLGISLSTLSNQIQKIRDICEEVLEI